MNFKRSDEVNKMIVYSDKGIICIRQPHQSGIFLFESVSWGIFYKLISVWMPSMKFNNLCYFRKRLKWIFWFYFTCFLRELLKRGCRIQFFNNIFLLESQVQIYKISVSFVVSPVAFVVSDISCVFVYIFSSFESLSWAMKLFFVI